MSHFVYEFDAVLQPKRTHHGFEMWRCIRDRFCNVSSQMSMGRLSNILATKFKEDQLKKDLTEWSLGFPGMSSIPSRF